MNRRLLSSVTLLTGLTLAGSCASNAPQSAPEVEEVAIGALDLRDLEGRSIDLEKELDQGHPVALVFWQTYCSSCRREAPDLIQAYERYGDRIRFIGVVPGGLEVVEPDEIRATAREWGLPYAIVHDSDLALTKAYGVQGTPTLIILGKEGEVAYKGAHLPDWTIFL